MLLRMRGLFGVKGITVKLLLNGFKEKRMKNIVEAIKEAQTLAFRENIETNMIFLNKNFAKTNPSVLVFDRELYCLPPMILGMEVQITDELPEKVSFALTKGATERGKLIAETEEKMAKEILILAEDYNCGTESDIDNFMLTLKERYGVEVE